MPYKLSRQTDLWRIEKKYTKIEWVCNWKENVADDDKKQQPKNINGSAKLRLDSAKETFQSPYYIAIIPGLLN